MKVLITTSGIGQRLGDITKYTNKALIRLGHKNMLSHIIDRYPESQSMVITVGYFAQQVKDFIEILYPKRDIQIVEVEPYEGEGASLGFSLNCAKDFLQCPFIYHACDTYIDEDIQLNFNKNWIAGSTYPDSTQYASLKIQDNKLIALQDNGAFDYDLVYVGLLGVFNYKEFWQELDYLLKNNNFSGLGDCDVIQAMLNKNLKFDCIKYNSWKDTGNLSTLEKARSYECTQFQNLDKLEESVFIYDNFVLKFYFDQDIAKRRFKRGKILKGLVPKVKHQIGNFYSYNYVEGPLYSRVVDPEDFSVFLNWCNNNLWITKKTDDTFRETCYDFYIKKTKSRIDLFNQKYPHISTYSHINNCAIPKIDQMIQEIDLDQLLNYKAVSYHGDLILDNIIKTNESYCLLDWRDSFGGDIYKGDIYYDLAKLNHNLIVNHDIVFLNLFKVEVSSNKVLVDINRSHNLQLCQKNLYKFIKDQNLDIPKVNLLTSLIWINSAPLHHYPYDQFLYFFGVYHLHRFLQGEIEI